MFERIKCYINLKKDDKIMRKLSEIGMKTGDAELVESAIRNARIIEKFKSRMWHDKSLARFYNNYGTLQRFSGFRK